MHGALICFDADFIEDPEGDTCLTMHMNVPAICVERDPSRSKTYRRNSRSTEATHQRNRPNLARTGSESASRCLVPFRRDPPANVVVSQGALHCTSAPEPPK
uniref:Uncharacterized protein n=1 Tax=Coccidioides posadasii RMSCC 3488 TaxID=454284 RepID=A0A0J6FE29_COCPO|nr:hypothetical protein CPAG_07683 [Coccidioides posadasii RMSCC 3488]